MRHAFHLFLAWAVVCLCLQPGRAAAPTPAERTDALLALVVERAAHQPFGVFVRQTIFGLLGMRETLLLDHPGQPVRNRAQGYTRDQQGRFRPVRYNTREVGDGQVMSSVHDLALWDRPAHGEAGAPGDAGAGVYQRLTR